MPSMQQCTKCNTIKELSEFYRDARRSDGVTCWCKDCIKKERKLHEPYLKIYRQTYYQRHKDRIKTYQSQNKTSIKASHLRRLYGLSLEGYQAMLERQGRVCAICQKPETTKHSSGSITTLSVDHCHTTNKVRGLLCRSCNVAIGKMNENPKLLRKAAAYLESP